MQRRIATATLCSGVAFWLAYSTPRPAAPWDPQPPPVAPAGSVASAAPPGPISEVVTARGLLDAAAGILELSQADREALRFGDWAKRAPEAAFAAALDHEDFHIAEIVIAAIAETDPLLALELAKGAENHLAFSLYPDLFRAWPQDQLAGAAAALLSLDGRLVDPYGDGWDDRMALETAGEIVAGRWPEGDAVGLLRWVPLLFPIPYQGEDGLFDLIDPRKFDDPAAIAGFDDPGAKALAASYLAHRGSVELGLRALELVPPESRALPIYYIARKMAMTDPQAALRFVGQQLTFLVVPGTPGSIDPLFESSGLTRSLRAAIESGAIELAAFPDLPAPIRSLLDLDTPIDQEARWIASLPDAPPVQERGFEIAERWAETDPTAASEWLGTLQLGEMRDRAIAGFARQASLEDPAAATAWAAEIGEAQLRERFLRVALRRWMAIEPEAAAAAVPNLGLSVVAVDSLLRR